jgi:hypothetical protein
LFARKPEQNKKIYSDRLQKPVPNEEMYSKMNLKKKKKRRKFLQAFAAENLSFPGRDKRRHLLLFLFPSKAEDKK